MIKHHTPIRLSSIILAILSLASCSTIMPKDTSSDPSTAVMSNMNSLTLSKEDAIKIHHAANDTLKQLYSTFKGSDLLVRKATAVLIFPSVKQGELMIGGEQGRGVLRAKSLEGRYHHAGFYKLSSVSLGLSSSALPKSLIFFFTTNQSFQQFLRKALDQNWTVGAGSHVSMLTQNAQGMLTSKNTAIQVIVLRDQKLIPRLTIDGTKIRQIFISAD